MEKLLILAIAIGTLEMTIKMLTWLWALIAVARKDEAVIEAFRQNNTSLGKFIFLGGIINGSLALVCWYMMINYVFAL